MRFALHDDQSQLAYEALLKAHRALVDKATSYSFDLTRPQDMAAYTKYREEEMNMARVVHVFKMQMDQPIDESAPLADWEKELLSGKNPQRSDQP